MIFKEIDNIRDVGVICHYYNRLQTPTNQTARSHPNLKDEHASGRALQLNGIQNHQIFVCPNLLLRNILTLLSVARGALLIHPRKYENRARVHFIPNLKVGVSVTLSAPDAIKYIIWSILHRSSRHR